ASLMGEKALMTRPPLLVEEDDDQAAGADPLLDVVGARPANAEIDFGLEVPGAARVVPGRPPDGGRRLRHRHPPMHPLVGGAVAAGAPPPEVEAGRHARPEGDEDREGDGGRAALGHQAPPGYMVAAAGGHRNFPPPAAG